jgi:hypothetical protein
MSTEITIALAGLLGVLVGSFVTAVIAIVIFRRQSHQYKKPIQKQRQRIVQQEFGTAQILRGAGYVRVCDTLLEAYETEAELSNMLRVQLDLKLNRITSPQQGLIVIVHNIIDYLARNRRIDELVAGMYRDKKSDELVAALYRDYSEHPEQFYGS